jgi:hypothetical protein
VLTVTFTTEELRRMLYCCAEELRARAAGKPPGVRPWLTALVRRLELEVAVSRSGHEFDCGEPQLETWMSAREAAIELGLSKRQTQRLSDDLDGQFVGGRWVLPRSAVMAYAEGRRDGRNSA